MTEPMLPHEILDSEPVEREDRLPPAVADEVAVHVCAESCPYLRRTHDGDPVCEVFDYALHPSFDAVPITEKPRAERCDACLLAEDVWGHR